MNYDKYVNALGSIKAPETLKKHTVKLLDAENITPKYFHKKRVVRKCAVMIAAAVFLVIATAFAKSIITVVYTADGGKVQYEEQENSIRVTFEDVRTDYAKVDDGKLYFVLDDIQIDVTDKCSDTTYYRHEITNADGSRNVIFVGGTVDNYGWVELVFDSDGKYIFNRMRIKGDDTWSDYAMHNEGVPCGNYELDKQLGIFD